MPILLVFAAYACLLGCASKPCELSEHFDAARLGPETLDAMSPPEREAYRDKRKTELAYWVDPENRFSHGVRYELVRRDLANTPSVIDDLHCLLSRADQREAWWRASIILAYLGGNAQSADVLIAHAQRPLDLSGLGRDTQGDVLTGRATVPRWLGMVPRSAEQDAWLRRVATEQGAKALVAAWFPDQPFPQEIRKQENITALLMGAAARGLILSGDSENLRIFMAEYERRREQAHQTGRVSAYDSQMMDAMITARFVQDAGLETYLRTNRDLNKSLAYYEQIRSDWPSADR